MIDKKTINSIKKVLDNMPSDWLNLTTHRLDLYNEELAKTQFLTEFEAVLSSTNISEDLKKLPTAFDYIRLGHPLSCILEWAVAKSKNLKEENVISFSSQTMSILAILRKNLLKNINTQIVFQNELPNSFDSDTLKNIYGYKFDLVKASNVKSFNGSTILLTDFDEVWTNELKDEVDFIVCVHSEFGSVVLVNGENKQEYISEIQHVRRRETIAMTPNDCFIVLDKLVGNIKSEEIHSKDNKLTTLNIIKEITNTSTNASIGSCGLSVQYAIMMGLIHQSQDLHPGKQIKFIVPPNCYGGTNDQARRVAACIGNVEVVDLPVDSGNDMVTSIERILDQVANEDAIAFIIAEIPTNPRVEVPDLERLRITLSKKRKTINGNKSIAPVFILDQTFCPNVKFLGEDGLLTGVKTISYVSGSKFPSGGLCTAGYCVTNDEAKELMEYVERHLKICENEATAYQIDILAKQMPSMIQRISDAYKGTLGFVNFIKETLSTAKINFVSADLAEAGFTPSVFSLDLPVKGDTHEEREEYKRDLNLKLIKMMIAEIPHESKYCVSYGQLAGCYWTIPATSTQGTTKEGDKDYIVRVSVSPKFNLALHNETFSLFCKKYI